MSKLTKSLLELSSNDLKERLAELKKELVEQKKSRAAGELVNPYAIKKTRRSIAVALTLLSQQDGKTDIKKEEEA
jgi:ribosomal protein L29